MPSYLQIVVLAAIQGLAELLPVSSSAHVIAAERLMGLDPSSPRLVLLLVMLHTGTMFAVLVYFWRRWAGIVRQIVPLAIATAATGVVGFGLIKLIEWAYRRNGYPEGGVEDLFRNLALIAVALAAAGVLILLAGLQKENSATEEVVTPPQSAIIGIVQGICLPFRGFSRSGATISTAMFLGVQRMRAEEFSFALAVLLTPAAIGYSLYKLVKKSYEGSWSNFSHDAFAQLTPGLVGMACSFVAGLVALRWLSSWLEHGRWKFFGIYCLVFAAIVLGLRFILPALP